MSQQSSQSIRLRKFPFPYKAAFTICSDIDGTSFENFLEIHRFLNTNQSTSLGTGLGLEIGDSFWFYSKPGSPDHAFAYFDESNQHPSPCAEIMRELMRAGYLDVLHSYGNFSEAHGIKQPIFSRAVAEKALNELAKIGVTIRTWVNHGDHFNIQNVGAGFAAALGDCPKFSMENENPVYHTDLLVAAGAKFFWESEDAVTNIVGQDRSCNLWEAYATNVAFRNGNEKFKNAIKGIGAATDRLTNSMINKQWFPYKAYLGNNRLLEPWTLRDGQHVFKFRRYGSGRWDWGDDIPLVMNEKILDHLIKVEGASILYVHLGDRRDRSDGLPLSMKTVDTLKMLAHKFHEGKIWVTTTSRLLTYCAMRDALRWHYELSGDQHLIFIDGLESGIIGRDWLTLENLQGLTFYTATPEKTEIVFQKELLPVERTTESVSLPFRRLEFPPV